MTDTTHTCENCTRLRRGRVDATHRAPQSGVTPYFYLCGPCAAGYDRQAFQPAETIR